MERAEGLGGENRAWPCFLQGLRRSRVHWHVHLSPLCILEGLCRVGTALKGTVSVELAPGLKWGLCLCSEANQDIPLAEMLGLGAARVCPKDQGAYHKSSLFPSSPLAMAKLP